MLKLTKGQSEEIILTLSEKCVITAPNYLFVFKSRQSGDVVKFVLLNSSNTGNTERYDKFSITVDTYFTDKNEGMYSYKVYEQEGTTNTDETGLNCVETGYMKLLPSTEASTTEYTGEETPFKIYNAS